MSKPYTPKANSLAARLLAELPDHGGRLTPVQIAEIFQVERKNVSNMLKPALEAGLIVHHGNGRGRTSFALPGVTPPTDGSEPTPATPRKSQAKKKVKRLTRTPREDSATVEEVPPPIAALFDDGDIALYGITPNADGSGCTLSDTQARRVHRFLERVFGPTE